MEPCPFFSSQFSSVIPKKPHMSSMDSPPFFLIAFTSVPCLLKSINLENRQLFLLIPPSKKKKSIKANSKALYYKTILVKI